MFNNGLLLYKLGKHSSIGIYKPLFSLIYNRSRVSFLGFLNHSIFNSLCKMVKYLLKITSDQSVKVDLSVFVATSHCHQQEIRQVHGCSNQFCYMIILKENWKVLCITDTQKLEYNMSCLKSLIQWMKMTVNPKAVITALVQVHQRTGSRTDHWNPQNLI